MLEIKKVVNGKTYNTATSQELGYNWNGLGLDDYRYFYEGLWQRFDEELYILKQTHDRVEVTPNVTTDQAKAWAEDNLTEAEYKELFDKHKYTATIKGEKLEFDRADNLIDKLDSKKLLTRRKVFDLISSKFFIKNKTDLDEEATWVLETVVSDKLESLSEKEKLSLLEELGVNIAEN